MMASASNTPGNRVCVIGAGALGLVAIKNLTEQGLDVTAFERSHQLGGTWGWTLDKPDQVTATELTTSNTSKQTVSDFPARVFSKKT